jgi:hypothetical protein
MYLRYVWILKFLNAFMFDTDVYILKIILIFDILIIFSAFLISSVSIYRNPPA